jgi:hypothetical protein
MKELEVFFRKLVEHLRTLPDIASRSDRHESWMSASQIRDWWATWAEPTMTAEEIDRALVARWHADSQCPIRPAKYPGRTTLFRLWGHRDRVGTGPGDLQPELTSRALELEDISLPWDTPQIFVCHSSLDLHLAARVRLALGHRKVRAWLAEAELREGDFIFEGVRAALLSSDAMLALVTTYSLSSAWVDTEIRTALGLEKPIGMLVDTSDDELMELVATWSPGNPPTFDNARLESLERKFSRVATETRKKKFREGAIMLLHCLGDFHLGLYPRRPAGWSGSDVFASFDELIDRWGLGQRRSKR